MADDSAIDPEIVRALEESMRTGKITADQYAIAMDRLRKQTMDVTARLVELSKKGREEADASKLRAKVLKDEKDALERSSKTRAEKDAEWALQLAKVLAGMHDATDEQRKAVVAQFQQTAALVKTEQRQKVFNDTLASTKSYLLPLGQAAGDVAKSLASSIKSNPLEASAAMATKYAEKAGQGLNAAGTAASGLGQNLTQSTRGPVKLLGVGLQGLGLAAGAAGTAANVAAQAISTIAPIMSGFVDTFKQANGAGATFGGGMSELRNMAGSLGTTMENLVGGVEKGQDAFQRGGLNFQQATRTVSQFGKGLVKGDEANQLFALGFTDVSERIALSGQAFDQLRARGLSEAEAKARLTETTLQYGKDLKVLQGIAGKNAEKELEKARIEVQRASIMTKLDGDQQAAFEQAMVAASALPGDLAQKAQQALLQKISGGAVTNPAVAGNEAIMSMVNGFENVVMSGSKTAAADAQKVMAEAGDKARANAGKYAAVDRAAIMGVEGVARDQADLQNALARYRASVYQGQEVQDAVNKATDPKSMDPTVKKFAELTTAAGDLQAKLQQVATSDGAVGLFATALGKANEATKSLIDMINSATSGKTGSIMESGAKGLMDVISSPDTWTAAAGIIGTEIALKMGASLLSGTLGTAMSGSFATAMAPLALAIAPIALAVGGGAAAFYGLQKVSEAIEKDPNMDKMKERNRGKTEAQIQQEAVSEAGSKLSGGRIAPPTTTATGGPVSPGAATASATIDERKAFLKDRENKKIPLSMTFPEWKANRDKEATVATPAATATPAIQATPVNPGASITPAPTAESVFGPEGLKPLNQQQRAAAGVDDAGNRVATTANDDKSKEQLDATRKQIALWEDIHSTLLDLVRYSRTTAEAVQ